MGDTGSVLVLTSPYDVTADVVLRILAERRVPVVRFDTCADLHTGASLTSLHCAGDQWGTLRTASRNVDTTRIRSVWSRKPSPCKGPEGMNQQDRRFAAEQTLWGAGGILASLPDAHYVNHPWNNRAAEYKAVQLSTAQRCDFLVPDTLITNDLTEVRKFMTSHRSGVVYKPLWNSSYHVEDQPHGVWVREVHEDDISEAVSVCPHMFQATVQKAFDARVTAVGGRLFGVRIDSPDLDWHHRQDLMTCTPLAVPGPVRRAAHAYLAELQLVYGAFDFAVTTSGEWYFLECNPNGQWAWQPEETTIAIAHAIAEQLEKGPDT